MNLAPIFGIALSLFSTVDLRDELYPDISREIIELYADLDDAMNICVQFKFITVPPAAKQEFETNNERLFFSILNASRAANIDYYEVKKTNKREKAYSDRYMYFTFLTDLQYLPLKQRELTHEERVTRIRQVRDWCDGENIKLRKLIDGYIEFRAKEK